MTTSRDEIERLLFDLPAAIFGAGRVGCEKAALMSAIDRVLAREAALERALRDATGEKPMLAVRIHQGDDVIVDAKELLRFVKFRIDAPHAALAAKEKP